MEQAVQVLEYSETNCSYISFSKALLVVIELYT
jgi:hypothetical protein